MRIFVLAIVMTIFSGSAFAVDGTNLLAATMRTSPLLRPLFAEPAAAASPAAKPIPGSSQESRDRPDTAG